MLFQRHILFQNFQLSNIVLSIDQSFNLLFFDYLPLIENHHSPNTEECYSQRFIYESLFAINFARGLCESVNYRLPRCGSSSYVEYNFQLTCNLRGNEEAPGVPRAGFVRTVDAKKRTWTWTWTFKDARYPSWTMATWFEKGIAPRRRSQEGNRDTEFIKVNRDQRIVKTSKGEIAALSTNYRLPLKVINAGVIRHGAFLCVW